MRTDVLWRVALVQLVAVALLSLLLGLIFSDGFFETWGWLTGPASWLACAWLTARVVGLEPAPTLLRAVIAGLLSGLFVLLSLHWLGALLAIGLFAVLCSYLPRASSAERRASA